MKTNESIGSDLKTKIGDEMLNAGVMASGMEGVLAANEFKRDIPENKDNEKNDKKSMNKSETNKSAKLQFKKDLQTDPDFKKFKEKDNEFGVPNVSQSDPFIKKSRYKRVGKEEHNEATGSGSAGGFVGPLFSTTKQEMEEECWKGYKEVGGKMKNGKMVPNCVKEDKDSDVKKVEATEATDSGSSGQYSTTSAWAKSTKKKDWGGRKKTQIPGGKFVQVKEKCKKFPYCNQGDIKALKIFENEKVKQAIQNISKRHNISENVIKTIIAYEYENRFSKK
jgi:hypothetical protein